MNLLYRRTQLHRPGFFVSAIYTTAQVFATKNLMKKFKHVVKHECLRVTWKRRLPQKFP